MPVRKKMFVFKYFGHRFTIFGEQAFSEWQLSSNIFYKLLLDIQYFCHLPKLNVKTLMLSVIKSLLNLKSKSKLVKL